MRVIKRRSRERRASELAALADAAEGSADRACAVIDAGLDEQARALSTGKRWLPSHSDWTRGRTALVDELDNPHNLPLQEYARLAHKSRRQIDKDVAARRLLALDAGRGGLRVPSWQLEPRAQRLTQLVLQAQPPLPSWTVYGALTRAMGALDGRAPVEAVQAANVDEIAAKVLSALGVKKAASRRAAR